MTKITVNIPEIVTERLILRAPERRDFEHMVDFYKTKRSYFVGGPRDENACWRAFQGIVGHWYFNGFGFWHLHHKADERAIGAAGFLFMPGWQEPELAWHLYDGYEGTGLAFEAALAARMHGAVHFGLDAPISYVSVNNTRSLALAKRLGAAFEKDAELLGTRCQVYRHPSVPEAVH